MLQKKSKHYLFVSICALYTLSVHISVVNAKPGTDSYFRTNYDNSVLEKPTYGSPTSYSGSGINFGSSGSSAHSYPPSNAYSGSGSSYGHNQGYPSNGITSSSVNQLRSPPSFSGHFGTNNAAPHSYPASPNSLSGSGTPMVNDNARHHLNGRATGVSNLGSAFNTLALGAMAMQNHLATQPNSFAHGSSGYDRMSSYPSGSSYNSHNTYAANSGKQGDKYYGYHFAYEPPTAIHYGKDDINYPVYRGSLPQYVFEYRSSKNKYRRLLAGLALLNLGIISTTNDMYSFHINYFPKPDEYCTFNVKHESKKTEEMVIDCRAITYFIYEDQPQNKIYNALDINNRTVTVVQKMLPNGMLAEPYQAQTSMNPAATNMRDIANQANRYVNAQRNEALNQFNTMNTMVPTQVMSVYDTRLDGHNVKVNSELECSVTRRYQMINMTKSVSCLLLEKYSVSSLHLRRNSSAIVKSSLFVILASLVIFLF